MPLMIVVTVVIGIYFVFNLGRLYKKRINTLYLRKAWKKTAIWLISAELLMLLISLLANQLNVSIHNGLYLISIIQLFIGAMILFTTYRNVQQAQPQTLKLDIPEKDLPTVSVCIPARNETQDLEECLRSIIASTYPKLEILVLDDRSQERRTPEIIRGFAHDGVRFIAGKEPPSSWLAKNYAYDQMADVANGEFLLFCGVDTRFSPDTITNLVKLIKQTNKSMLSILPKNVLKSGGVFGQSLIQPVRYAWELCLPRSTVNRPPVLSTCWIIAQASLKSAGGFDAISHKSAPESYFAKLSSTHSGYDFVISGDGIGLSSVKSIAEQRSTTIRTRYPQLHRRPELVALLSTAELMQLLGPIIIFMIASFQGNTALTLLSGATTVLNLVAYSKIVDLTYRRFLFTGLFSLPIAVIYDVCLLNYSMWQYEFGEVVWKDRNISTPILQVIPELPTS